MKKFRLVMTLAAALWWPPSSDAADLSGVVDHLNDGDEFFMCVAGTCFNIRLCGIDTPSKGKPGHEETMAALGELVVNKKLFCKAVGEGSVCDGLTERISRGRLVAQCFVEGTNVDVAATLVERGLACDRKDISRGYYSKDHPERVCPP
jgi:endonuclease YncB( thermonuclease family)